MQTTEWMDGTLTAFSFFLTASRRSAAVASSARRTDAFKSDVRIHRDAHLPQNMDYS